MWSEAKKKNLTFFLEKLLSTLQYHEKNYCIYVMGIFFVSPVIP